MQRLAKNLVWERSRRAGAESQLWELVSRLAVLAALACSLTGPLLAEESPNTLESQVKAAFIVKFASFIEWPAGACPDTNAPFLIGILGADPFGTSFDEAVRSEHIKGRKVEIRRAYQMEKLGDCQMVFVAGSELDGLEKILRSVERRPILLITDAPGAAQRGSMINFFKESGKVRFEFNVAVAESAHLRLSGKLLQVGKVVVPGQSEGRLGS